MKKTIYRHVLTVEILSEEPLNENGSWPLEEIASAITDGDWSGATTWTKVNEPVEGKDAVKAVIGQGSDPEFFQMDKEGNDLNEDLEDGVQCTKCNSRDTVFKSHDVDPDETWYTCNNCGEDFRTL